MIQSLRDLAMPGLMLSGNPEEGPLLGNQRPILSPPGRGPAGHPGPRRRGRADGLGRADDLRAARAQSVEAYVAVPGPPIFMLGRSSRL